MSALPSMAAAPSGAATVSDALIATAEELERVRVLGLRVEQAICVIAVRSAIDGAIVAELQQLDAMLQQVAALRDFLGQLALEESATHSIDLHRALDRVSLADVRTRLGGDGSESDEGWEIL